MDYASIENVVSMCAAKTEKSAKNDVARKNASFLADGIGNTFMIS